MSLDHCGFPPLTTAPWSEAAPLFALSRYRNLYLKVTSHLLYSAEEHGGDPRDFVARLVDAFGADRITWGSDFSQTHDRPYPELVEYARWAFSKLTPDARAACLGGNALRLWPELARGRTVQSRESSR